MVVHAFSQDILLLFNESQKSKISHGRLVKSLLKHYSKAKFESFWPRFRTVIQVTCRECDRSPPMERLIAFIVKFALEANVTELKRRSITPDEDGFGKLLAAMFKFCLQWHSASGPGARLRCVQIISQLLEGMGADAMLSETMFVDVQEMLLKRIWDTKPVIRAESTRALSRLQDPTDRDCPVVTAFLYLLRHDANPDVRKAAIQSIAITTRSLPEILSRSRDVSDVVRRTVFDTIVDKVSLRPLTIAKRIKVLKDGMSDRSSSVRDIVSKRLLPAWFSTRENSFVMLLKALDVEGSPNVCEKACILLLENMRKADTLKEYIDKFSEEYLDQETRVPKLDKLCSESAFFWRLLVEYLKGTSECPEDDSLLERCMPLGSALGTFLRTLLDRHKEVPVNELEIRLVNEFIASHVITLAKSIDITDEFGRKSMKEFVRDSLIAPTSNVCHGLVSVLLDLLVKIDPNAVDSNLSNEVVEMISELREPMEEPENTTIQNSTTLEATLPVPNGGEQAAPKVDRKLEMRMAAIKVSINVAKEELDDCIARMDFEAAGPLRDKLKSLEDEKQHLMSKMISDEMKARNENIDANEEEDKQESDNEEDDDEEKALLSDVNTLIKANTMAVELLKRVKNNKGLTPSLRTLVTSLILPGITNSDPGVRNLAVTSLGLICILDRGLARKYLPLLRQICRVDHVAIRVSALKSVFDCFLVFGLDAFKDIPLDDPTHDDIQDDDNDATLANFFRDDESVVVNDDDSTAVSEQQENLDETATTAAGHSKQTSMLAFIIDLLDSEAAELRTVCVEGLVRLVYLGLVTSSKLLSRLLLLWFNPLTEDDTTLRHCLAVFLPAYCFIKSDYQATMAEAVMPTLHTLFLAPTTSPLKKVDIWNVASLMIHLTDAANLFTNKAAAEAQSAAKPISQTKENAEDSEADKENILVPGQKLKPQPKVGQNPPASSMKLENPCHDELALVLSNALLNDLEPEKIRLYVRMLNNLRISTVNLPLRKELYVLLHNIFQKKILDKLQTRSMQKFKDNVKTVLIAANVDVDALLMREETQSSDVSIADSNCSSVVADRRMASLLAEEKRRRKQRRSSFTRNLCGSDEEPTLLEETAVADQTVGKRLLNKTTVNTTMMERTYLGAKFKERGNVTVANMTQQEETADILVNNSDDEEEAEKTLVKSESDEEMSTCPERMDTSVITVATADETMNSTLEVSIKEVDGKQSSTLTPQSSSVVSSVKEESSQNSRPRSTRRSSRSKKSFLNLDDSPDSNKSNLDSGKDSAAGFESSVQKSDTSSQDSGSSIPKRRSARNARSPDRETKKNERNSQPVGPTEVRRRSSKQSASKSEEELKSSPTKRITRRTSAGQIEGQKQQTSKRVTRSSLGSAERRVRATKK